MSSHSACDPKFKEQLLDVKLRLLRLHYESNSGHLGGNLSCIDAVYAIHSQCLAEQDEFILSKGHSAGALYVTLWKLGLISEETLASFNKDNTTLPAHPSGRSIPGLSFSTGSLGHGPSLAAGLALAMKHKGSDGRVFCLCSDGEWQEGSCWEALTFAVHQKLDNLIILIDQNGLQGFGSTQEVISCGDLTTRCIAFCTSTLSIDGHDNTALLDAVNTLPHELPRVIILNTVKGKGLHSEGQIECHYLPLTSEQYGRAVDRLTNSQN